MTRNGTVIATLVPPIGAAELEAALHALRITRMLQGASGNMTVTVEGGNIVVREGSE